MSNPVAAIRNLSLLALAFAAVGTLLAVSPLEDGYSAGASAPGLVAAYSFDDGSGSTAADATGRGSTAAVSGATWTSDGRFGGALVFDGVDDLVRVGDSQLLDLASALTLEAWVKPSSATSGWRPVVVRGSSDHGHYGLYVSSATGGPSGHVRTAAGDAGVGSGSPIAAGTWSHLAMTYDGNHIQVFVNGSPVASHQASGSVADSADPLEIGGRAGTGERFAGVVDEVRVYSRALSPAEIASDMADALGGSRPVPPSSQEAPVVSGTPAVETTLTSSPGKWAGTTPMTYAYAWSRCDAAGSVCLAIPGATGQSYAPVAADAGSTLRSTVTASNAAGSQSATSAPTAAVQLPQLPAPKATTDTSPPTAPTGVAVAVSGEQATVTWKPSTDNVGVAGYGVYREGVRVASTARESYVFTGVLCGVSWTVGVDAFDAAGNRSAQTTARIPTRPCFDAEAPTAPTRLRVTRTEASRLAVAWDAARDNVGVVSYGVYLDGVRVAAAVTTNFTFTGLTCGRRYTLGVDAVDAAGNRSPRATIAAETSRCQPNDPSTDSEPPTAPTNLTARTVTATSVTLAWTASTDNKGVAGYGLYVGAGRVASTTSTSYTFSGLSCGTSYSFSVDAFDEAANRSPRASVVVATAACSDTQAPTAPEKVVQKASTANTITITWAAATDNVGVAGYGLYRADTRVATTNSTEYTFSGLTCGTVYALGVDAYDAAGNRSGRTSVWIATSACPDTTPPSTPTSLAVTGRTASSVSLAWKASTDNIGVAKYDVYRDIVDAGDTSDTSFTVNGLECGTSYAFAVEAVDGAGNRSTPARLTASTSACAPSEPRASAYVAVWGVDSNPCIQEMPCATFNRAYKVVEPGGTVGVGGGSYPPQTITEDTSKGPARVTFRPLAGATVNVDQIDFGQEQLSLRGPDNVTIEGLNVAYTRMWGTSDGIVLLNLNGKTFDIFGGIGNTVYGGSYGPCEATQFGACTNRMMGTNTVVDGASIHGVTSLKPGPPDNLHVDGIFVRGCSNCTIRNSKFWDNDTTHVRVQNCCGLAPIKGLKIENNWFDRPTNLDKSRRWNAVDLDSVVPNLLVRNNSFHPLAGISLGDGWAGSNATLVGNISSQPWSGCRAGMAYRNNVWTPWTGQTTGYTCGSGDKLVKVNEVAYEKAVDGSGMNYHLGPGSPAIGAGDPGNCPSDDIDRQTRSGSCDAGSDQR